MLLKNRICFIVLMLVPFFSYSQQWPILQSDDANYWNKISATFGEIHPTNGDHLHGAIDIDVSVLNCPVRAIEDGEIDKMGAITIGVKHPYPSGTNLYYRKSRYLHTDPIPGISLKSKVNRGDQIAIVEPSSATTADHLHLEMWQFDNGVWYKINPLGNDFGWEFPSPPDNDDPEVNDVYLEPVVQPNNVTSGFSILNNSGALVDNTTNVKIHLANRPGSTGSTFNFNNNKLVVFGNIIPTVRCRDVSINFPLSSGNGLTVHRIKYRINNNLKYHIYFDKVFEAEHNLVSEIFRTAFNSGTDYLYGNNDFIQLYTTNGVYLSPDKTINSTISNGVWFTKALNNSQHVFATTPTTSAGYNGDALYPDGENTLNFEVEDASGRTNSVDLKVIVDNFRPYVKQVIVTQNSLNGTLAYVGGWKWNPATNQLAKSQETRNDIKPTDRAYIKIIMSEPCTNVKINIPNIDGTVYYDATTTSNPSEFIRIVDPIAAPASQRINIQAEDLAGNSLQTDPAQIPFRQANGTWSSGALPGIDSWHYFNTGTSTCSSTGGRVASNGRTASGCLYADFTPDKFTPAIGEAVTFTPVVAGKGVITYSWDFGSGAVPATSTSAGPQTVIYSTSGPKTVSLKICDNTSACVTDLQTSVLNVGAPPSQLVVDFSADRFGANTGDNIRLTSVVTGAVGPVSYAWDFGEGILLGQFSDINPLISYSTPGNKSIQLRVTDANGSVTTVKNDYLLINSTTFNVSVSILSGCGLTGADGSASFSAAVSGGNGGPYDSYMWDFGDGNTSHSSGIVPHTYKKSGKYTVRLTVCDGTGCATGESIECVTVPSIVDANTLSPDFLIEDILLGPVYSPIQIGLNTPVTFSDATTGGGDQNTFTYNWDFESHFNNSTGIESGFPGIASTKGAHEIYYTVAGKKEVSLGVVNQTLSRRQTKIDAIDVVKGLGSGRCFATIGDATISSTCWSPTNLPKFTVPVSKTNCPVAKTEVIYWPDPGQGIVLPGNKLDFAAMGLPVPDFPFTADFSFSVYQSDGISYNRIGYKRQRFTIYGPVSVDGGLDKQVCTGSSVIIGTTACDNLSYKWTSASASNLSFLSSANIANPVFTGTQKGTYTFSVRATDNQSGCSSALNNVSVVVDKPVVTPTSFTPPFLNGNSTIMVSSSDGFGGNSYSWSPGTNLSSTTVLNPTFNSSTEGEFDYLVTVTDQLGCSGIGQVSVYASDAGNNVQISAEGWSRILITWEDKTDNETGFVIQRSVGNTTTFIDLATVQPNTTSYEDLSVQRGIDYYYKVITLFGGIRKESTVLTTNTNSLPEFTKVIVEDPFSTFGDYDNDGLLEFVASSGVYKYTAQNTFVKWKDANNLDTNTDGLSFDFDNDGDLDFLRFTSYEVIVPGAVLLNNTTSFSSQLTGFNAETFAILDIDNDNDCDLIANPTLSSYHF